MLTRITVRNILSFNEEQTFSMLPGQGRKKKEHKTDSIGGVSVLKTAAVYGPNASGKSNLIRVLSFAKYMVLRGTRPDGLIDYDPFRLAKQSPDALSLIEIELQANGKNYIFGFEFNHEGIKREWLSEYTKRSSNLIYSRNEGVFDLEYILRRNKKAESKQYLQFFAQSTPNNQLFLHEAFARNIKGNADDVDDLLSVVDWFMNTLKIIFPSTAYKQGFMIKAEDDDTELKRLYAELLRFFDTGIVSIKLDNADIDKLGLPQSIIREIKTDLLKSKDFELVVSLRNNNDLYLVSAKGGQIIAKKLMTVHKIKEGGNSDVVMFSLSDESDGTQRLFDYIPLIFDLFRGSKVFVVDEIERSLHPALIYQIFSLFLNNCSGVNSQLIVTTHETALMTQDLLRKDEVRFMKKNEDGESHINSLEDNKVRFDKELRNSYLDGEFSAIPQCEVTPKLKELLRINTKSDSQQKSEVEE
jgi:AAA15 family ATPase/GTPase